MATPSQSCLLHFVSEPSNLDCPYKTLIPNSVHPHYFNASTADIFFLNVPYFIQILLFLFYFLHTLNSSTVSVYASACLCYHNTTQYLSPRNMLLLSVSILPLLLFVTVSLYFSLFLHTFKVSPSSLFYSLTLCLSVFICHLCP